MATAKNPGTLVLLRHGESTWNLENLFTGWHDVPLSERGVHEAKEAGRLMQESGLRPAIVHESLLLRADVRPPDLEPSDKRHPSHDPRYATLPPELLPNAECLKDVVERMLPYWYDAIVPDLRLQPCVLISAHGNSLRALVKHLDGLGDQEVVELNIPTGVPRVYELGADLRPRSWRYLGDPAEIAKRAAAVKAQSSKSSST